MKSIKILSIFSLFILISSCTGYGEKLEFNGTEVYYLDSVTKAEAEQLGEFLVEGEFANGKTKSVQFSRDSESNNFVFKMVVNPEAIDDPNMDYIFKTFTTELMTEFEETVDFHLADNTFNTIKIYKGQDEARSVMALKTEIRYTPKIKKAQAEKVANYLIDQKFANDTNKKTVMLDKENDVYLFKMVVDNATVENKSSQNILKVFGSMLSQNVFGRDSLRVQMCNSRFEVVKDLK